MSRRLIPVLMCMIFGLNAGGAAWASADQANGQAGSQLLRAGISKQDSMSRSELEDNNNQLSLAAPVSQPGANNSFGLLQGQAVGGLQSPLKAAATQSAAGGNLQGAAKESDMAADIKMREYNVDWAAWIAKMADRWYFVLKGYEDLANVHFVTVRPALIQFTCYSNGSLGNIMLKQSSGNPAYDRLQMIALMQAVPVPQFPYGTKRQSITLVQGWESHVRQAGESEYEPGSFGRGFPMEKVKEWVKSH
jgi:TonB C terminal